MVIFGQVAGTTIAFEHKFQGQTLRQSFAIQPLPRNHNITQQLAINTYY
jgi:hypothetical protein